MVDPGDNCPQKETYGCTKMEKRQQLPGRGDEGDKRGDTTMEESHPGRPIDLQGRKAHKREQGTGPENLGGGREEEEQAGATRHTRHENIPGEV